LSLDSVKLPEDWSEEEKSSWRQKQNQTERYYQVNNNIAIQFSAIERPPSSDEKFAINAKCTFFNGIVIFPPATFNGIASFDYATFNGIASFDYATFNGIASFDYATFSGIAYFRSITFSGGAYFDSTTFSGEAYFDFTTFSRVASFDSTTFGESAYFDYATFSGRADFGSATFIKLANFNSAGFFAVLNFKYVDFQEYTDLRNARIRRLDWNSVNSPTLMSARLDLRGTTISEAHIQDVTFEKDVYFSDVRFGVPVEKKSNPDPEKKNRQP